MRRLVRTMVLMVEAGLVLAGIRLLVEICGFILWALTHPYEEEA